jgi:hypothetical protein
MYDPFAHLIPGGPVSATVVKSTVSRGALAYYYRRRRTA